MDDTVVKIPEENEDLPLELLAEHVAKLASIGKQLKASKLKERLILLLLKDMTGISMTDIGEVLKALPKLEQRYLK